MRFQESLSVAANSPSGNVLSGKQLEFPGPTPPLSARGQYVLLLFLLRS